MLHCGESQPLHAASQQKILQWRPFFFKEGTGKGGLRSPALPRINPLVLRSIGGSTIWEAMPRYWRSSVEASQPRD
jgi:hypothetical protein